MIDISPQLFVILAFACLCVFLFSGYYLGFVLAGVAFLFGYLIWEDRIFAILYSQTFGILSNYTFIALPMFVFMGAMIEKSGLGEAVFEALEIWLYRLKGHLAIVVIITGTILAACMGIIAGSIVMMGLAALPHMIRRGYNKELACGSICAGGCLGILIPPSVMLVVYGPMADISVGKLFMGAFGAGLTLSGLYIAYIIIVCIIKPEWAPSGISENEIKIPWSKKFRLLSTSLLPVSMLILAVLGSIFFGVATPTEAAAAGAFAASLLALARKKLTWSVVKEVSMTTGKLCGMFAVMATGALCFLGVFMALGGGEVVADFVISAPGGKWGFWVMVMVVIFILGMFIGWIGIIFILVPIVTPIATDMGFDPIWFAMTICVNLQMMFMTPPMATAIYYLRGTIPDEYGINTGHIIRGVYPFVGLIWIGLGLFVAFPQIILYLPSLMRRW